MGKKGHHLGIEYEVAGGRSVQEVLAEVTAVIEAAPVAVVPGATLGWGQSHSICLPSCHLCTSCLSSPTAALGPRPHSPHFLQCFCLPTHPCLHMLHHRQAASSLKPGARSTTPAQPRSSSSSSAPCLWYRTGAMLHAPGCSIDGVCWHSARVSG